MAAGLLLCLATGGKAAASAEDEPNVLSLAGEWRFRLDPDDAGIRDEWFNKDLPERIRLPGSLQEQGFGHDVSTETPWTGSIKDRSWFNADRYAPYRKPGNVKVPFWLQPEKHYIGPAWYQRTVEVPTGWKGRRIALLLERCHWTTTVWVDGSKVGSADSLSVPHTYDLTAHLAPGPHRLTIRVDNRMHVNVGRNAHSVTDHTQSNWNGITGRIELRARPPVWIEDLQVHPDVEARRARVEMVIGNAMGKEGRDEVRLDAVATNTDTPHDPPAIRETVARSADDRTAVSLLYPLGKDAQTWDEFHPALYRLAVTLDAGEAGAHRREVTFGLREIGTRGTQFVLNGRPIFLRGTLECCIFPKTGYPPTDVAHWKRIIRRCRACGLNHMRFHSWCPPEAAFTAADELGFYFQVEGPCWTGVGRGKPIDKYIYAETDHILRAYGNHPSFLLMAYGNEPGGPGGGAKFLGPWVTHYRKNDPRRLWTSGSGWPHIPENQYHVMHRPLRLHGRLHKDGRRTALDYRDVVARTPVPLVSHESGQWCVFPNLEEIEKYTGVLKARNFEIVRDFLRARGMLDQAHDFLMASGRLQALMYKQEIEAFLRTPGLGGFQLLQLHDFPGQGTALVGVLDPFFAPKGYVTAEAHRRYCGPVVPLARLNKRTFTSDGRLIAEVDLANYGPDDLGDAAARWTLRTPEGRGVSSGTFKPQEVPRGTVTRLGRLSLELAALSAPAQLELAVALEGADARNAWDLWVYPDEVDTSAPKGVRIAEGLDEAARAHLADGGSLLLMPPADRIRGDTYGAFAPIFWNKAWFPRQKRHTLGILCDPSHPALEEFPTEFHSNWQWYDLNVRSKPVVLDGLPEGLRPIVRVIDDWNTCRRLGLVFEARVGEGRLLFSAIDLATDLAERPAARQMRRSLLAYAASEAFDPKHAVTVDQVRALLKEPTALQRLGAEASADSQHRGCEAARAIDGDPKTIWHTRYEPQVDPLPHHLLLDLKKVVPVRGIAYLPRQDQANGRIARFKVYLSRDGKQWGRPAASGAWPNSSERQRVRFEKPRQARQVKLVAEAEVGGNPWTSAAEVDVILE